MNLNESLDLINTFYTGDLHFGDSNDSTASNALEEEKGIDFPQEFKNYVDNVVPLSNQYFSCVGNPLGIYSREKLSWRMNGYNYNPVTNEPIDRWDDSWFIFADEGADPVIIKLDENRPHSGVYKAMHGAGKWDFHPIADSVGQFLLCAAAVDHALTGFAVDDSIIDDESGFCLAEEPAKWLFPFMRKHASGYYDEWVSVFENS